jgi:thioredoxin 1
MKKWHRSLLSTIAVMAAALLIAIAITSRGPALHSDEKMEPVTAAGNLDFNRDVLESSVPVLVDFWAPWCGPCRVVGPIIQNIAEKAGGKVKVIKINVDEYPEIARQYQIIGIPTVMIFRKGAVEKTLVGIKSEEAYLEASGL